MSSTSKGKKRPAAGDESTSGPSGSKDKWTWSDEMLMYDVVQRDSQKKKQRCQKVNAPIVFIY